jgi:hypothetical protein
MSTVVCSGCRVELSYDPAHAGGPITCGRCGLVVPTPLELEDAPRPARRRRERTFAERHMSLIVLSLIGGGALALFLGAVGWMLLTDYMRDKQDRRDLPELRAELVDLQRRINDRIHKLAVKGQEEPDDELDAMFRKYRECQQRHLEIVNRHPEWGEPRFPAVP